MKGVIQCPAGESVRQGEKRFPLGLVSWAFASILLLACATPAIPAAARENPPDIAYQVAFEGVDNATLQGLLEGVSNAKALEDRPPSSRMVLENRVRDDLPKLLQALHSRSYYGARLKSRIDTETAPWKVAYEVDAGPPYLVKEVDISLDDARKALPPADEKAPSSPRPKVRIKPLKVVGARDTVSLPSPEEIGLVVGRAGESRLILDAQETLLDRLKNEGYPFPRMADRKVLVDHSDRSMRIAFRVDPGPEAPFGATTFQGLEQTKEEFLWKKIPWEEGDPFDARLLKKANQNLVETGLFTTVRVSAGESLDGEGRVPMLVELVERKRRTIKVGAGYKTDEGVGGKVSWENRNLLGGGEKLQVEAVVSQIQYSGESTFTKPYFLRDDQRLRLEARVAEDRPDGFTSQNLSGQGSLERDVTDRLTLGLGSGFKVSKVDQMGEKNDFILVGVQGRMRWDTSDDLFDPHRGGRLNLQLTPTYDLLSSESNYVKTFMSYSRYFGLMKRPDVVLAGRVGLGSITGIARDDVPADERFYAGGGGSIRGFGYQLAGELDENDDPVGGRSLLEMSLETRFKLTESLGMVVFLDGGSAFEAAYPDPGQEDLLWGTGLGFRYFSPIGPFRVDVGVPINKRSGVDNSFQFYMSVGQAF